MKKLLLLSFVVLSVLLAPLGNAFAEGSKTISFQGVLLDDKGTPLNDELPVRFELYDAQYGGNQLWGETQSVTFEDGYFNVYLGAENPLDLQFNQDYFLQITVADGTPYERTPLSYSPYAFSSETAKLADLAQEIPDGSVTLVKLADEVKIITGDVEGTLPELYLSDGAVKRNIKPGDIETWMLSENVSVPPSGPASGDLTGTYPDPKLADEAVTTRTIKTGAITWSKLQTPLNTTPGTILGWDGTKWVETDVPTWEIGRVKDVIDGRGLYREMDADGFMNIGIADDGIISSMILDGEVMTADLADMSVTNVKLAADAVTSDKIMDGEVMTADLAGLSVTNEKLAADAVTSDKILDGEVMNADLAADAVTSDKIMDGEVMTADLADMSVTNAKLADGAVDLTKLEDGTALGQVMYWDGTEWRYNEGAPHRDFVLKWDWNADTTGMELQYQQDAMAIPFYYDEESTDVNGDPQTMLHLVKTDGNPNIEDHAMMLEVTDIDANSALKLVGSGATNDNYYPVLDIDNVFGGSAYFGEGALSVNAELGAVSAGNTYGAKIYNTVTGSNQDNNVYGTVIENKIGMQNGGLNAGLIINAITEDGDGTGFLMGMHVDAESQNTYLNIGSVFEAEGGVMNFGTWATVNGSVVADAANIRPAYTNIALVAYADGEDELALYAHGNSEVQGNLEVEDNLIVNDTTWLDNTYIEVDETNPTNFPDGALSVSAELADVANGSTYGAMIMNDVSGSNNGFTTVGLKTSNVVASNDGPTLVIGNHTYAKSENGNNQGGVVGTYSTAHGNGSVMGIGVIGEADHSSSSNVGVMGITDADLIAISADLGANIPHGNIGVVAYGEPGAGNYALYAYGNSEFDGHLDINGMLDVTESVTVGDDINVADDVIAGGQVKAPTGDFVTLNVLDEINAGAATATLGATTTDMLTANGYFEANDGAAVTGGLVVDDLQIDNFGSQVNLPVNDEHLANKLYVDNGDQNILDIIDEILNVGAEFAGVYDLSGTFNVQGTLQPDGGTVMANAYEPTADLSANNASFDGTLDADGMTQLVELGSGYLFSASNDYDGLGNPGVVIDGALVTTGNVISPMPPVDPSHLTNKAYVDAADAGLQAALDQEIQDRMDADALLQDAIDQEVLDREAGDDAINGRIDDILNVGETFAGVYDLSGTMNVSGTIQPNGGTVLANQYEPTADLSAANAELSGDLTVEGEGSILADGFGGYVLNVTQDAGAGSPGVVMNGDLVAVADPITGMHLIVGNTTLFGQLEVVTGNVVNAMPPMADDHLTNKLYVDAADAVLQAAIDQEIIDRTAGDDAINSRIDDILNVGETFAGVYDLTGTMTVDGILQPGTGTVRANDYDNTADLTANNIYGNAGEFNELSVINNAYLGGNSGGALVTVDAGTNSTTLDGDVFSVNHISVLTPMTAGDSPLALTPKAYVDSEIAAAAGAIQAELDATQAGAGLNPDGTYLPNGTANYIAGATSLANADDLLDAALMAEATTRAADDATLQTNIDNEEAARIAADNTLQTNIDNEEAARIAADNTLQTNIDNEEAARIAADNTLQANIDAEEAARIAADAALQTELDDTQAGAGLGTDGSYTANGAANYIAGATTLVNADDLLDAALMAEATTRAADDATLQANIDAEEAARIAADNTLQTNIDNEEAARIAADNTLQTNIDNEEAARIAADNTLQANIDAEEAARIAADGALQTELDDTQAGAGLGTDGSYTPDAASNYITSASSLFNADQLLDAQVKVNADNIAAINATAPVTYDGGTHTIGLDYDATLAVAGGNLGVNLNNVNTWTANQTFPTAYANNFETVNGNFILSQSTSDDVPWANAVNTNTGNAVMELGYGTDALSADAEYGISFNDAATGNLRAGMGYNLGSWSVGVANDGNDMAGVMTDGTDDNMTLGVMKDGAFTFDVDIDGNIDGNSLVFADGNTVNEVTTTVDNSSTDAQLPTALAVYTSINAVANSLTLQNVYEGGNTVALDDANGNVALSADNAYTGTNVLDVTMTKDAQGTHSAVNGKLTGTSIDNTDGADAVEGMLGFAFDTPANGSDYQNIAVGGAVLDGNTPLSYGYLGVQEVQGGSVSNYAGYFINNTTNEDDIAVRIDQQYYGTALEVRTNYNGAIGAGSVGSTINGINEAEKGSAASFTTTNSSNGEPAVAVLAQGNGATGIKVQSNGTDAYALEVIGNGTAVANNPAMYVTSNNNTNGQAIQAVNESGAETVLIQQTGTGNGLTVTTNNDAATGRTANFTNSGAAGGVAGFQNTDATNDIQAVTIENDGTAAALYVDGANNALTINGGNVVLSNTSFDVDGSNAINIATADLNNNIYILNDNGATGDIAVTLDNGTSGQRIYLINNTNQNIGSIEGNLLSMPIEPGKAIVLIYIDGSVSTWFVVD